MTKRIPDSTAYATNRQSGTPSSRATGLYRPEFEHDACGIAYRVYKYQVGNVEEVVVVGEQVVRGCTVVLISIGRDFYHLWSE
jgi:hypothetical protein